MNTKNIFPIFVVIVVAICVGLIVFDITKDYHDSLEVTSDDYRNIDEDFLIPSVCTSEQVYHDAHIVFKARLKEAMSDDKLTNGEYKKLANDRREFIIREKFKQRKRDIQERLTSP